MRALEALYRTHVERVYGLCRRMVADEARAEELTQDTWVRVWESLESFRFDSAFGTWLYRVATNVVLQSERGRRRRRRRREDLDRSAAPPAPRAAERGAVDRIALERAIADLPPRARAVLVLHDLEGHTHAEVARILKMAEGTSRAHLFFARERLRRTVVP